MPARRLIVAVGLSLLCSTVPVAARTWHVPGDAPTIQAGIDSAQAGDAVLLACGAYQEHDIALKSGIHLQPENGSAGCVTIDAAGAGHVLVCQDVDASTVIEGLVLQGGLAQGSYPASVGGGVLCLNSSPIFRQCTLQANAALLGGGMYCREASSPTLESCQILANTAQITGGGFYCFNASALVLRSCIVSGNVAYVDGGGLYASTFCTPVLESCTLLANNAVDGSGMKCASSSVATLTNVLIAFGVQGEAIQYDPDSTPLLTCCDLFGNETGNWSGSLADQLGTSGNIEADPQFCSSVPHLQQNWTLQSDSPCVPPQSECGVIGALGAGCASVGVRQTTWGELKNLYR